MPSTPSQAEHHPHRKEEAPDKNLQKYVNPDEIGEPSRRLFVMLARKGWQRPDKEEDNAHKNWCSSQRHLANREEVKV